MGEIKNVGNVHKRHHKSISGEEISSEFELDSNDSVDSVEQPGDEDDDGEWNMMGAALEREFLGFDD